MKRILKIAKDFSEMPGPRYKVEGDFSGEVFRKDLLEPSYAKCKASGDQLLIDLDNTEGYATSFIEESFGGLKRLYPNDSILDVIEIKSDDEPFLIDEVKKCVAEALDRT